MRLSKTIVINCAGMGSRLGFGYPKALLEIAGKPIIAHHLDLLDDFDDVRVVVGFEASRLIEVARSFRKDLIFVFNHEYRRTNTLASLHLGSEFGGDLIVSIDGDLLINPQDLRAFLKIDGEVLGYTTAYSDQPVYVRTKASKNKTLITELTRRKGALEWSGLAQIRKRRLSYNQGFVYQILTKALPMEGRYIDCREIDTPNDLKRAQAWAKGIYRGHGQK